MDIQIKFILVETSHAGNIGSTARAIKVMGFNNLVVVNPKCQVNSDIAIAMAGNAQDILKNIQIYDNLNKAIADSSINIAISARTREYSPPVINSQDLSNYIIEKNLCNIKKFNIIFGNEQSGLKNEDIMKCTNIIKINANPLYSSLNLSQAVQIIAYELSKISLNQEIILKKNNNDSNASLANHEQIDAMHSHFLKALQHISFYNPLIPKKLSQRLQKIWLKSNLTKEEVNLLRGIAKNILNNT